MVESCPGRVVQQQIGAHERAQPRARTSSAASTSTPTPRTRTRSARRARRSTVSACAARSSASLTPAPSTTNSPSSTRSVPSSRRSSSSAAWTGGVSVTACRRRLVGMDPSVAPVSHRTCPTRPQVRSAPATELSTRTARRLLPEGTASPQMAISYRGARIGPHRPESWAKSPGAVRSTCKSMGPGMGSPPLRSSHIAADSRGFGRETDSLPNDEDAGGGSRHLLTAAARPPRGGRSTCRACDDARRRPLSSGRGVRARLPHADARGCSTSRTTSATSRGAIATRPSLRARARGSTAA